MLKYTHLQLTQQSLNYNSFFLDRAGNKSLNETYINQDDLNGTRNLTQQDMQTPTIFVSQEIVETKTTTARQSISPIHPNLTTPKTKNPTLPQVTIQSTVKPSVAPKYS